MIGAGPLKNAAQNLGFLQCGVSKATFLEEEAPRLERWLQQGNQGEMHYLENHFDKRLDPRLLVPGAQSVISLSFNYFPPTEKWSNGAFKIARYAYGEDYHLVLKEKLTQLVKELEPTYGTFEGRIFVDSAPVMERQWAQKSGLGWQGKNTLLLSKQVGSYFFLAEIIGNWAIEPDGPTTDHCGTCTRCIDACPTQALSPYHLDASKCISYLTIELKDRIPDEFNGKSEGWVFGCDICQEVCPWNRFSQPHSEPLFASKESWEGVQWEEITEDVFQNLMKKSPIKRTKFEGFKRNVLWASKKST
ncbi:MAG: tRNA epoxyqueuosine(34) reductase QueG [Bacteroidia bacterium]|jgi:epoxyqueuosine reductase